MTTDSRSITWGIAYGGQRVPIRRGELVIGRSAYCTLVVGGGDASRQHAAITLTPEGPRIADLGSRNGTFVNGEPVREPRLLAIGDRVRIGSELLVVVTLEAPGSFETLGAEEAPSTERTQPVVIASALALIEQVLDSADPNDTMSIVRMVQRSVDDLLASSAGEPARIERSDARRLLRAVERVAEMSPDGGCAAWCEAVSKKLMDG